MTTLVERFTKKYVVNLSSKCWEWIGPMDGQPRNGSNPRGRYGRFAMDDYGTTGAHRASFLIFRGTIPAGLQVCHSCDNPVCVNPDHLWLGTFQQNIDDQVAKGRNAVLNGAKPRLGTGVGHKSPRKNGRDSYVDVACSVCGTMCEQSLQNAKHGKAPCCSMKCKGARNARLNEERAALLRPANAYRQDRVWFVPVPCSICGTQTSQSFFRFSRGRAACCSYKCASTSAWKKRKSLNSR